MNFTVNTQIILFIITGLCFISGLIFGIVRFANLFQKLQIAIEHLTEKIEKISTYIDTISKALDELCDRVTRVEESTKSAHKRIDELIK